MKKLILILSFMPILAMGQDIRTISHDRTTAVDDYANIFSESQKADLNTQIGKFFDTVQISVVTIPTIGEYDISEEAVSLANRWGVGSKADNGLLLVIAVNDHKMFAATGRAIQSDITDLQASRLQREIAVPLFKEQRYYDGTRQLLTAYIDLLSPSAKEYRKAQQAIADKESADFWATVGWISLIVIPLLIGGLIWLVRKERRTRREREAETERLRQEATGRLRHETPYPSYSHLGSFAAGYGLGSMSKSSEKSSSSSGSSSSSSSSNSSSDSYSSYGSSSSSNDSVSSSSDSGSSSSYDFGGGSYDGGGGGSSW